jgi:hypothetical protein
VSENGHGARLSSRPPVLDEAEVDRRLMTLAELQAALNELGVRCVLARQQRLVLRYNEAPLARSGPTDPTLHVFTPDGIRVATTDGAGYKLEDIAQEFPAGDAATAAVMICRALDPAACV